MRLFVFTPLVRRPVFFPQIGLQLYANLDLGGDCRLLICIIRKSSNLFLYVPTPLEIAVALSVELTQLKGLRCAFRTICIQSLKYTTNVTDLLRIFIFPSYIWYASAVKFSLSFLISTRLFDMPSSNKNL